MGLFDMFVAGAAHAAGSAARDAVREQHRAEERSARELDRRIEVMGELADIDLAFTSKCRSLGFDGGSISNYTCLYDEDAMVAGGRSAINAHKRELDEYIRKLETYIELGGKPENFQYPDEIDQYLDKLRYLNSIGALAHQDDVAFQLDMEDLRLHLDISMGQSFGEQAVDLDSLDGQGFERVCRQLIESMGFTAEMTKASGDGGIDILAYNTQPLLSGKYVIQCKRYAGSVGEPIIRDLYGVVMSERANKGILMTTGTFTRQAREFASEKQIELIDGEKLGELLGQYGIAERLDSMSETVDGLHEIYESLESTAKKCDEAGLAASVFEAFDLNVEDPSLSNLLVMETVAIIDAQFRGNEPLLDKELDFIRRVIGFEVDANLVLSLRETFDPESPNFVPRSMLGIAVLWRSTGNENSGKVIADFLSLLCTCTLLVGNRGGGADEMTEGIIERFRMIAG